MEEIASQSPKNNLYLFAAAIAIVFLGFVGYFYFSQANAVPEKFFSSYQKTDTLAKEIFQSSQFDYGKISMSIKNRDASEASALSKQFLIESMRNQKKEETLTKQTAVLKTTASDITDTLLKQKILKLFGLLDQRNRSFSDITQIHMSIHTTLRNYFGLLLAGGNPQGLPQNIDVVVQSSQQQLRTIEQLQAQIDAAYEEIVKLAGYTNSANVTVDTIKANLSKTPDYEPVITDFPTIMPPTAIPTPTFMPAEPSSSSADTVATVSASPT